MGSTSFSSIFSTPAAGVLVDKYGRKTLLISGSVLLTITGLPFIFLDSLNFVFFILKGCTGYRIFTLQRFFTSVGMPGSFIYGFIADYYNYFIMFKLSGAVCLIAFISLLIIVMSRKDQIY